MDEVETEFLETQHYIPLTWFWYIGGIFFVWAQVEEELNNFVAAFNNYKLNLKFT